MSTNALATVARQRAVLSTIADVIVAAAHDKNLRVAVHSDHGDDDAFADRLTQALLARGRDCRCPPAAHGLAATADQLAEEGQASSRRTVVISSRPADPDGTDTCLIEIQVNTISRPAGPRAVGHGPVPDERGGGKGDDVREPDIVVDYLDSVGPSIRHLAAWLAPSAQR